jgi:hypothetical protein
MSLYEFNLLSKDEKIAFTWEHCLFLMNHTEDESHTAALYYCQAKLFREEFFVELWYNTRENAVDSVVSFRTTKRLEAYLGQIRI